MKLFSKEFLEKEYGGDKNKGWTEVTSQPLESYEKEYDMGLKLLLTALAASLFLSLLGLVFQEGTMLSQGIGLLKEVGVRLLDFHLPAGYFSWHPALTQIVFIILEMFLAAFVLSKSKAGRVFYIAVSLLAVLGELGLVLGWFSPESVMAGEQYLEKPWAFAVSFAQIAVHVIALALLFVNKRVKLFLNYHVL